LAVLSGATRALLSCNGMRVLGLVGVRPGKVSSELLLGSRSDLPTCQLLQPGVQDPGRVRTETQPGQPLTHYPLYRGEDHS
jgi:hypothetical protein